jgi:hypothetical protein
LHIVLLGSTEVRERGGINIHGQGTKYDCTGKTQKPTRKNGEEVAESLRTLGSEEAVLELSNP